MAGFLLGLSFSIGLKNRFMMNERHVPQLQHYRHRAASPAALVLLLLALTVTQVCTEPDL